MANWNRVKGKYPKMVFENLYNDLIYRIKTPSSEI